MKLFAKYGTIGILKDQISSSLVTEVYKFEAIILLKWLFPFTLNETCDRQSR